MGKFIKHLQEQLQELTDYKNILEYELTKAKEVIEYMDNKDHWYVDKDGWMVLLRPRDSYTAGEVSAYIPPWEFIADVFSKLKEG